MLTFINTPKEDILIQFIVDLLYLGKISKNSCWAESYGTEQAVKDLLSTVSDSFISTANNILVNGSIRINSDQRLVIRTKMYKDVEEYQDIVDILRGTKYGDDAYFSYICKSHLERLTEKFSVHEDLHILK